MVFMIWVLLWLILILLEAPMGAARLLCTNVRGKTWSIFAPSLDMSLIVIFRELFRNRLLLAHLLTLTLSHFLLTLFNYISI